VTADTVRIVAVMTPGEIGTGAPNPVSAIQTVDRSCRCRGSGVDAYNDSVRLWSSVMETYGRAVQIVAITSSGVDAASQHADASKVIAEKPFMAVGSALGPIMAADLVAKKIVVVNSTDTNRHLLAQAPYHYAFMGDDEALAVAAGELVGKVLVNNKAQYAGDVAYRTQVRKWGVLYPTGDLLPLDPNLFYDAVRRYGGVKLQGKATEATYPHQAQVVAGNTNYVSDQAADQRAAVIIVAKMKQAGVTTMVPFADQNMLAALTKQATAQGWKPEWIITCFSSTCYDGQARGFDQDQWSHAFGILALWTLVDPARGPDPNPGAMNWYFGRNAGTTCCFSLTIMEQVMSGIQMAGPNLTAETFNRGLFAMPAAGGAARGFDGRTPMRILPMMAWGKAAKLPYPQYHLQGNDFSIGWYNPNATGNSNATPLPATENTNTGKAMYLFGGKRFRLGQIPEDVTFFDPSRSDPVTYVESRNAGEANPKYPCNGCPSSA
jgi:hypothetical protein